MASHNLRLSRNEGSYHAFRNCPIGFSFTVLFFGPFPPLLRQDWLWAFFIGLLAFITFGFTNLIFCWFYNKVYLNKCLNNGYKVDDNEELVKKIELRLGRSLPRA